MLPDRWKRVRSVLDAALEHPAGERDAFVAEACGDDRELAREVLELLAADRTGALAPPSVGALEDAARRAALASDGVDTRIGPFVLEARIASGGMGEVWRARRVEGFAQVEGLEQTVAIKLIKLGMDTEEMLRRFANERALLAGLQHDGIARLFDGGADQRGRPYLVMEFVDGVAIDRYCADRGLSIRERIALFLTVCDAVQYAHEHRVLHRDIKPSNVLVARDGRPKLCDFGIAKVLAETGDERASQHTLTGQRVLTPAYASPEQLHGDRLTAQSDVYSLGLLLWELCVGERAFQGDRAPDSEVGRASTALLSRTGSRRFARELAGDLDTILATACHPDPKRRYASVGAFAGDLGRFLALQPVSARRDSVAYRVAKFTRRNRLLVGSLAAVFLALASATIISSRMYVRAAEARDKEREQSSIAAQRFEETREIATKFLFDVHDSISDLPGATAVRETLLSKAASTLDRLAAGADRSRDLDLDLFAAYTRLAEALCKPGAAHLGRGRDALRVLDTAQAIAERFDEPARTKGLARIEYRRGESYFAMLEYERAELYYASAYELVGRLRGAALDLDSNRLRGDAAARLVVTIDRSRDDERACWAEALAASRALQSDATPAAMLHDRAVLEDARASVCEARGDWESAYAHRLAELAAVEELALAHVDSPRLRARTAQAGLQLAKLLRKHGRATEGVALERRACDVLRELTWMDPHDVNSLRMLCGGLESLGSAQFVEQDLVSARDTYTELAAQAALYCENAPADYLGLLYLGTAQTMLAASGIEAGDWAPGLDRAEDAVAVVERLFAIVPESRRLSPCSFHLQVATTIARELEAARTFVDEPTSRRALDLAKRALRLGESELAAFEPRESERSLHGKLKSQAKGVRARLARVHARAEVDVVQDSPEAK